MELLEIETDRLRLRPFGPADVDDIHRLWIDPGVRKYLWDDEVIPREQAEAAIEESVARFRDSGLGLWAASLREEPEVVGFCGYWFFRDPPELELLYGVATEHWGRGFASEMARALIGYGFQELALDRIVASTDAANIASVRVMEKCGMRFDRREIVNGLDTIFYTIRREEFSRYLKPDSPEGG